MKYYKVLGKDGAACHGGHGEWNLPRGNKPGKWMPKIKDIEPCERGYHLCEAGDLLEWLNEEIYEAEGRGKSIRDGNKTVFEQARLIRKLEWNERTARLFACECAERVLPIFEKHCPNDDRPHKAIEAARRFTNGEISQEELAAARAAARADAAWAAVRAAARDAAWDAARAAARDAASSAAWAAEKKWQTERLFEVLGSKE